MPFARSVDAFPIVISTEYVDLAVGDSQLLIAADLGTPGEPLLASLHAIEPDAAES